MPTSEEELKKKRDNVEKLRQQVADEEAKRVTRERELSNDVTAAQLDAEAVRLEARLAAAKDSNKVAAVKEGASAPLDQAKAEMRNAATIKAAQEKAQDRNSESDDTKES